MEKSSGCVVKNLQNETQYYKFTKNLKKRFNILMNCF